MGPCGQIRHPRGSLHSDAGIWLLVESFRQAVSHPDLQHPQADRPGRGGRHCNSGVQHAQDRRGAADQLIVLLIVIGLCAAALFVTGALMSANKATGRATLTIHRIAPLLAVLAALGTLYLLGGRA